MFGDDRGGFLKELHDFVVVFLAVQPLRDSSRHATHHAADEAVLLHRGEVLHIEQVDGLDAHLLDGDAEFLEGNAAVAPFADGVVDFALQSWRSGLGAGGNIGGGSKQRGAAGDAANGCASGQVPFHALRLHQPVSCANDFSGIVLAQGTARTIARGGYYPQIAQITADGEEASGRNLRSSAASANDLSGIGYRRRSANGGPFAEGFAVVQTRLFQKCFCG